MATDKDPTFSPVSVVIPVRDRPAQLRRALFSILPQQDQVAEVLVVDDGSSLPLDPVVAPFAAAGLQVSVLSNVRSPGAPGARNTGIAMARGAVISLLDSDDVWLPHHLAAVLDRLDSEPKALGVVSDFVTVPTASRRRPRSNLGSRNDQALLLRLGHGDLSSSTISFRNGTAALWFDETLEALQDYEFALQMQRSGRIVTTGSVTVAKYNEAIRVWNPARALRSRAVILDKWSDEVGAAWPARHLQRWQTSYERALVDASLGGPGGVKSVRRKLLQLRPRLAREAVAASRNLPL